MLAFITLYLRQFRLVWGGVVPAPRMSRRQREAQNNFALLRRRLDRENQLHALMLSQRHYRRKNYAG